MIRRTLTSEHAPWARHRLHDIAVLEAELPVEDATEGAHVLGSLLVLHRLQLIASTQAHHALLQHSLS